MKEERGDSVKAYIKELELIQKELITCKDAVRVEVLGNRLKKIEKELAKILEMNPQIIV